MPDYSKGKIYLIKSDENDKMYLGSTYRTLMRRWQDHKDDDRKKTRIINCQSRLIIWDASARIELLENYPCKSREELLWRERYWFDKLRDQIVNLYRPIETKEEKSETNRIRCAWRYTFTLKSQSRDAENNLTHIDPSLFQDEEPYDPRTKSRGLNFAHTEEHKVKQKKAKEVLKAWKYSWLTPGNMENNLRHVDPSLFD